VTAPKKTSDRRLSLAALLLVTGCGGAAGPGDDSLVRQWSLPDQLREISGLALTEDERLLAVDDEVGIVYELDYENGGIVKTFAFGDPVIRGDFEGIAVLTGKVWLMTSDGDLLVGDEGADGESVGFERFETGIGEDCELEGLAELVSADALLLLCKDGRDRKKLRMYEWHPVSGIVEETKLPEKDMERAIDKKRVSPSGVALRPGSDERIVVVGIQHAVFAISPDGELNDVIMRLDKSRHRQAEGIAMTRDGRMLIADEGGKGRARLAIYRWDDGNNKN
jgi:uncharacterized protein YjiK